MMDTSHFLFRLAETTVRPLSGDGSSAAQRQLHSWGHDHLWRNEEAQKYHFLQLSSSTPVFDVSWF